ncbi:MAG: hypothetical protein ACRD68_07050, partial [Pyrinomonadaceae bacterium]
MLRLRVLIATLIVHLSLAAVCSAQVIGDATPRVQLTARNSQALIVPANSAASLTPFVADPETNGGDIFHAVSDNAGAAVSLILPDGTEIDAANAASRGFTHAVIPDGAFLDATLPSLLATPGTHTVISLPANAPAGTYHVKVNTSGVANETLIVASFISSSPIRTGLVTDASVYRVGDTVVLSGLVFDGPAPVTNASVVASVGDPSRPADTPVAVTLTDSGPFDGEAGDGIYTGTFSAGGAGDFTAAIRTTGRTAAGRDFARLASTTFRVIAPLAAFSAFQDAGVDDDFN